MNKHVNLAQLRYNTDSNGRDYCWRLVLDDKEILVQSVKVNAPVFTSRDWIEQVGNFKHHISVKDCRVTIDDMDNALIEAAQTPA